MYQRRTLPHIVPAAKVGTGRNRFAFSSLQPSPTTNPFRVSTLSVRLGHRELARFLPGVMSLIADANDRFPSTILAGNYTRGAEEVRTSGNQDPPRGGVASSRRFPPQCAVTFCTLNRWGFSALPLRAHSRDCGGEARATRRDYSEWSMVMGSRRVARSAGM